MKQDTVVRGFWLAALLILFLTVVIRLSVLVATPSSALRDIADYLYDDAYYYLTIAANLADFGKSTLDGITATNGYQPLWLLTLAMLAKLVGTDAHTLFVANCALIYAIACSAPLLALLWRGSGSRTAAFCIAAGMALLVTQQPTVFLEGLEPILMAPIGIVLVVLLERGKDDPRTTLQLSAVLALCFLVRLDGLSLFIMTCLLLPLFNLRSPRLGASEAFKAAGLTWIRLSAFVVPTVALYLTLNQWLFGSAVPVSGRAKSLGGSLFSNWGVFHDLFGHWKPFALLVAILIAAELLTRSIGERPPRLFYRSLAIVSSAIAIQYLYYAAFSSWYLWPWYAYLVALDMALIVARTVYLASLLVHRPRAGVVALVAVAFIGIWTAGRGLDFVYQSLPTATQERLAFLGNIGIHRGQIQGTISQEEVNAIMLEEFFKDRPKTLIAMGDRSGGLAYWGRGKLAVVQTEGLTLGADYLKARMSSTADRYLESLPIDLMIIDRETVLTAAGNDGRTIFVVPDPIQGRITKAHVPTFCFPESAIRYNMSYPSGYALGAAVSHRIAFEFAERVTCTPEMVKLVRDIETGIGLRQYSLPSEYDSVPGGLFNKKSEDHDRRHVDEHSEIPTASNE
jgi:hypothetical protein